MTDLGELMSSLPSATTARQRAAAGLVNLVSDDMDDYERDIHLRYGIPAHVDCSRDHNASVAARQAAWVESRAAEAAAALELAAAERGGTAPYVPAAAFSDIPSEVVDGARRLCDSMERDSLGYWLHGLPGRGKTTLASHALRFWRADGWSGELTTEAAYLNALRAAFDNGGADAVRDRYASTGLLVLDDVGVLPPTQWSLSELEQLVDRRWSAGLRLLVTSNRSVAQMAEAWSACDPTLSARIVSRLSSACRETLVGGPDHRPSVRVVPTEPGRHRENPYMEV